MEVCEVWGDSALRTSVGLGAWCFCCVFLGGVLVGEVEGITRCRCGGVPEEGDTPAATSAGGVTDDCIVGADGAIVPVNWGAGVDSLVAAELVLVPVVEIVAVAVAVVVAGSLRRFLWCNRPPPFSPRSRRFFSRLPVYGEMIGVRK